MLKHTAFAFLLVGLAFAQREYAEHLDDAGLLPGSKIKCIGEVPKDFACAMFFDIDPPFRIDIVSVNGGGGEFSPPLGRAGFLFRVVTLFSTASAPPLIYE